MLLALDSTSAAYRAGYVAGVLLALALGVSLLVAGLRRRRTPPAPPLNWAPPPTNRFDWPAADESPTSAAPAASDFFATPPTPVPTAAPAPLPPPAPPSKGDGTGLIVAGALVLALGLVSAVGTAKSFVYPKRTVALPPTLLGASENPTLTGQFRSQLLDAAPSEIKHVDLAIYGTPPKLIVIAGTGHLQSPKAEIASFQKGLASSGRVTVTGTHKVDAGPLGGEAQCSSADFGAAAAQVCVFVDRGSFEASIEFGSTAADAPSRGLEIRNAVVQKG